jgi:hypothetical protein
MPPPDDPRPIDRRDGLALPVERVDRAPGTSGRGRLVAGLVALSAIALVVAGLAGRQLAVPTDAPLPLRSPRASPAAVAPSPAELAGSALPDVASTPLEKAPLLALWRRDGDDAEVLAWDARDPGSPPRIVERITALLRGVPDAADLLLADSPTGRYTMLAALRTGADGRDVGTVRIADTDGTVVWSVRLHGDVLVAPAWNPVRDELLVPAPGAWLRVVLDADGSPTETAIAVPTFDRPWSPSGPHPLVPKVAGFSPNGRVAYAAAINSPFGLGLEPLLAIDLAARRARRIDTLPSSLADESGRGGPPDLTRIDPLTGRVIGLSPPGGSAVRVFAGDGVTSQTLIRRPGVLGASWAPSGLLAVLSTTAEAAPRPEDASAATKLELFVRDGTAVRTPFTTGPAQDGTLIAAPDGFSLIIFGSDDSVELVLVRLQDGAAAAITLPSSDLDGMRFLGWRSPSG